MLGIKTYKELLIEKDITLDRIQQLKTKKKLLKKELRGPTTLISTDYSKERGSGIAPRPLDDVLAELMQIDNIIFLEEEQLKNTEKTIAAVDNRLKQLDGLFYKVAYKKVVEKKPLQQIADELGYSLDYIKEISSKIK